MKQVEEDLNRESYVPTPKAAPTNVTKLERVDAGNYYSADRDKGSVLGSDLESALWNQYNNAGKPSTGGGGGNAFGDLGNVSVDPRAQEFMDFQKQTTDYTSNMMKDAGDAAKGMFGQGAINQITGDNDIIVQRQLQQLEGEFAAKGMDSTHPAFVKEKTAILAASRIFNNRAMTDMAQKAGQYKISVGELAKNFYDSRASKEEEQQKLLLGAKQFNEQMKFAVGKQKAAAARAGAGRAFGQQMAALAAISSNRKFEAEIGMQASTTELQARSADKVSMMNYDMENKKINAAMAAGKSQQKSSIWASILGAVGTVAGGLIGFAAGGPGGAVIGANAGGQLGKGAGFSLNQNTAPMDFSTPPANWG